MLPGNPVGLRAETLMIQQLLETDNWLSLTFTEHSCVFKPQEDCPTYLWEGNGCDQRSISRPELISVNNLLWKTVKWEAYQVTVDMCHFIHIAHKHLWKSYQQSRWKLASRSSWSSLPNKLIRSGHLFYFQDFRNGKKLWQRGQLPLQACYRVSYWMSELSVPASSEIFPWSCHVHHPVTTHSDCVGEQCIELRLRKFKTQVNLITHAVSNLTSLSSVSSFTMWDHNPFLDI